MEPLELTELCTTALSFELVSSSLLSASQDCYVLKTKTNAIVLQENFANSFFREADFMKLSTAQIKCAAGKPTDKFPINNIDVFDNASEGNKHLLMLDQNLIPSLTIPYLQNQQTFLAPNGIYLHQRNATIAATLNTLGALEIHHNLFPGKTWTKLIDVSQLWFDKVSEYKSNLNICKMDDLLEHVAELTITAFCWSDCIQHSYCYLICGLKSGSVLFWKLNNIVNLSNISFELIHQFDNENRSSVTYLSSITLSHKSFLVVGDIKGNITLHTLQLSDIERSEEQKRFMLWDEDDEITVSHVKLKEINPQGPILILIAKAMHLLLFVIDQEGNLLSKSVHYIGHVLITGIQNTSHTNYMISTYGPIFQVNIAVDPVNFNINITKNEIKKPNSFSKYTVHGIAASRNRAFFLFALYPTESFDHLILRKPTNLVVCTYSPFDPFKTLLQNPSNKLTNIYDCIEVIRYNSLKNGDYQLKELMSDNELKPELTDSYMYRLKLKNVGYSSYAQYFKIKDPVLSKQSAQELELTSQVLDVISLFKSLRNLSNLNKAFGLNDRQKKCLQCLKFYIRAFLSAQFVDDYNTIQNEFRDPLNVLLNATADVEDEDCSDLFVERCCLTKLEIVGDDSMYCANCTRMALSKKDIQEILGFDTDYLCPVCDVVFVNINTVTEMDVVKQQIKNE